MAIGMKEHITTVERTKWDKVVVDFANHLGSGGDANHMRANGTIAGFSINDYTTAEKNKLGHYNEHPRLYDLTFDSSNNEFILTGKENGVQVSQTKAKQTTYTLTQSGNNISLVGSDGTTVTVETQALAIWG